MDLRLIVPWRSDGGWRERLWDHCRPTWDGWPLRLAPSPEGPFNRAAAINDAAAGDWDAVVVADADILIEPEQVRSAVLLADLGRLVLAYTEYRALTERATRQLLEGVQPDPRDIARRRLVHESSCVVIPRSVWDAVGGFDERFVGWGQEDVAFVQACRVLTGEPLRVRGTVTHLWHPYATERSRTDPLWRANQELGRRYRFTRDEAAMRALIEERVGVAG